MKYSKKLCDLICGLVATGDHTIEAICVHVKINTDTYYDWKKKKPDFSEALKAAEEKRLDTLGTLAQSGLAVLLTKHEFEETKVEYAEGKDGKPKIKSQTKTKKFIMPNPTAVIFALTNRKPGDWKQKQSIEHTGKDGGPIESETRIKVGYGNRTEEEDQDPQD